MPARCPATPLVNAVLLALAGVVWTLQGLGYVGGSFMSGATIWTVLGPVAVLVGLVVAAMGRR